MPRSPRLYIYIELRIKFLFVNLYIIIPNIISYKGHIRVYHHNLLSKISILAIVWKKDFSVVSTALQPLVIAKMVFFTFAVHVVKHLTVQLYAKSNNGKISINLHVKQFGSQRN